jgi:hypothetical protein
MKIISRVTKGKLLGFTISKFGIMIDPKRTQAISQIAFPHNKKSMQCFLGKINLYEDLFLVLLKLLNLKCKV